MVHQIVEKFILKHFQEFLLKTNLMKSKILKIIIRIKREKKLRRKIMFIFLKNILSIIDIV